MDEISYHDSYRRKLRQANLQKPCSRLCLVSSIKEEYQSSAMATSARTQMWDPTGRVYILIRVDKIFTMFNEQLETLGRADAFHSLSGIVLIYPSMVLLVAELPTDSILTLEKILVASMGTAESYVIEPTLISEAHNVERMYDNMTAVVLNIPGPMKMDLDRMKDDWKISFGNVMKKIYHMGRAIRSKNFEAKHPNQKPSINQRTDELRPPNSLGPSPSKRSYASLATKSMLTSNRQTKDSAHSLHDGEPTNSSDPKLNHKGRNIDNEVAGKYGNSNLNAEKNNLNAEKSTSGGIFSQSVLDLEFKAFRCKRLMLDIGDPALRFIPPQRDLVLILNCDTFQLLSRSVALHTRDENDLRLETGWPCCSDDEKFPPSQLRK